MREVEKFCQLKDIAKSVGMTSKSIKNRMLKVGFDRSLKGLLSPEVQGQILTILYKDNAKAKDLIY